MTDSLVVRRGTSADLPALGRLGADLLRVHFGFDQQRFMAPGDDPEGGYAWFLGTQLASSDVVVFVAELNGDVIGYVYAGIEPQNWKELRDEAGFIHDVVVEPRGRRLGVATALLEAAIVWCRVRGMPRVVLWAADANSDAQRLFSHMGFRRTMVEMTREL
jgi:GNAT superfamily N-acetyltransferase